MTACIVGWAHTPFGKLANERIAATSSRRPQSQVGDKL
jgi:hypothetical protein